MRVREPVGRHWALFLLVYPGLVIAATVGVEQVGITGHTVLVLFAVVWISALLRYVLLSRWMIPRMLAFLGVTAAGILLLRPAVPDRIPEELAEVLLRELLEGRSAGRVYFVEVDGRDPSPDLLARLGDLGGGRDFPREAYDTLEMNNVKDGDTGEYGTLLRIRKPARAPSYLMSLSVDIESHTGGLNAWGRRCLVVHLVGWRITGGTMEWVA